ncbi:AraC family mar-sox-rob regulon transcriptional activator [Klebsiella variicola]|nr:AraC family mar-sox-rob regulon transcriptional activator [Klebsiella variicola]
MAKTGEAVSPKMIPVVQGIVDWIEAHILDTLPVSTIAKKSGYSHWYFQRQFAMVTGCTLANYVSRRKMTIATIYLTQTQASIQSISQCLGYDGQAAFCRTFHRHFGMSPTPLSSGSAGQGDEYAVSFDGRRERRAGEAVCRRSGRPGSANGFRRHDATSANIMANPVILAQGGDLYITTCAW